MEFWSKTCKLTTKNLANTSKSLADIDKSMLHANWCLLVMLFGKRTVKNFIWYLVFFVVDQPNNGQHVLEVVMSKPNRERQKLIREQNILKQVSSSFQKKLGVVFFCHKVSYNWFFFTWCCDKMICHIIYPDHIKDKASGTNSCVHLNFRWSYTIKINF